MVPEKSGTQMPRANLSALWRTKGYISGKGKGKILQEGGSEKEWSSWLSSHGNLDSEYLGCAKAETKDLNLDLHRMFIAKTREGKEGKSQLFLAKCATSTGWKWNTAKTGPEEVWFSTENSASFKQEIYSPNWSLLKGWCKRPLIFTLPIWWCWQQNHISLFSTFIKQDFIKKKSFLNYHWAFILPNWM